MTMTMRFSYPGNESPGTRGKTNSACFRYSAEAPSGQCGGGTNSTCFGYSPDVPPEAGNLGTAQPALPGLRQMPVATCFRY